MKKIIYSLIAVSCLAYASCTKTENVAVSMKSSTVTLSNGSGSIKMDTSRAGRFTYDQAYYSFNTTQTIRVTNGTKNTLTKTAAFGTDSTYKMEFLSSTFSN